MKKVIMTAAAAATSVDVLLEALAQVNPRPFSVFRRLRRGGAVEGGGGVNTRTFRNLEP